MSDNPTDKPAIEGLAEGLDAVRLMVEWGSGIRRMMLDSGFSQALADEIAESYVRTMVAGHIRLMKGALGE